LEEDSDISCGIGLDTESEKNLQTDAPMMTIRTELSPEMIKGLRDPTKDLLLLGANLKAQDVASYEEEF